MTKFAAHDQRGSNASFPHSSATSPATYQAAAAGVTAAIMQSVSGVTSASAKKNPQLRSVAIKEPACQALETAA